ncbi:MAG: hypothetical protein KAY32_14905 [Candidatus Eisenbacteria sp.]|nr:hypothetical protein [Candidatus Eisenbacteria bacterium]
MRHWYATIPSQTPPGIFVGFLTLVLALFGCTEGNLAPDPGSTDGRPALALKLPPKGVWSEEVVSALADSTHVAMFLLGGNEVAAYDVRPIQNDPSWVPDIQASATDEGDIVLSLWRPMGTTWWRFFVSRGSLRGQTTLTLDPQVSERTVNVVLASTPPTQHRLVLYEGIPLDEETSPPAVPTAAAAAHPERLFFPVVVENPEEIEAIEMRFSVCDAISATLYIDPGSRLYDCGRRDGFLVTTEPLVAGEQSFLLSVTPNPEVPGPGVIDPGCDVLLYIQTCGGSPTPGLCVSQESVTFYRSGTGEAITPDFVSFGDCPGDCDLAVTAPDSGCVICVGREALVTWTASAACGNAMRIELLQDGSVCETLAEAAQNTGSFSWIPAPCSERAPGYSIRVTDLAQMTSAESPGAFSIFTEQAISLTEPNGGESFCPGRPVAITWESSYCCGSAARIELLHDGQVCATIADSATNETGFSWIAEACADDSTGYAVRVTDRASGVEDESDATFSIRPACTLTLFSPAAGATFCPGDEVEIIWSRSACCGDSVRIDLLQDETVCATIAAATPNDGQHSWGAARCVADGSPDDYRIAVTDLTSDAAAGMSGSFSIAACEISLTLPSGPSDYCAGDDVLIEWEGSSCCGNSVAIELLHDGEICRTIAATTANDGSYLWTAQPCDADRDYQIRVCDLATGAVGTSESTFAIERCAIDITAPAESATFCSEESVTIQWTSRSCCDAEVAIDLLQDGQFCRVIAAETANDGDYVWPVAGCDLGGGYQIAVRAPAAGAADTTAAFFAIETCQLEILAPIGPDTFCAGQEISIVWTSGACCGEQVGIDLVRDGEICHQIAAATENDGVLLWLTDPCEGPETGYRIRLTDSATGASAESPETFTIARDCDLVLSAPNGGQDYCAGEEVAIVWEHSTCCGALVRIELLHLDSVCETIADATDNDGEYAWIAGGCPETEGDYRIRVTDLDGGAADDSDATFEVLPACYLDLTAPGGNEVYCVGDSLAIRWDHGACCGPQVRIDLLQSGTVCRSLAAATENDGSYTCRAEPCGVASGEYQVEITNPQTGAMDRSAGYFEILAGCDVAVTSPAGDGIFCEGDSIDIAWETSPCCGEYVRIELLQHGATCGIVAASTPNDGAHRWAAAGCGAESLGYRLRVVDLDSDTSAESEGSLTIRPACLLTVAHPNGGEDFCAGMSIDLLWSTEPCCGPTVGLDLLHDGIVCLSISAAAENTGRFTWQVEPCPAGADGLTLRVTDPATGISDQSDAVFSISTCAVDLVTPNGGEVFCEGESQPILWESTSCCSEAVQIELLQNGSVCSTIAASTPNDGSYPWMVVQCASQAYGYTVRVTDLETGTDDTSDGSFTIQPPCGIAVTHPASNDEFCADTPVEILWNAGPCCGDDVRIELLRNGAVCNVISPATPNDGSYLWTAAQCASQASGYTVRVTDLQIGASGTSAAEFRIQPPCAIGVLAPNGGEDFCAGTFQQILWNSTSCCSGFVKIELLRSGVVCRTITSSTPNDGSHPWTAAQCASQTSGYTIRVTDLSTGQADRSNGEFRIESGCGLNVSSPPSGASYLPLDPVDILWAPSACCGSTVRIELRRSASVCRLIAASTPNDGSHQWSAEGCAMKGDDYSILITDLSSGASATSPGTFTIQSITYIRPDGSGTYATIQQAIDSVPAGHEIYLADGTFIGPGNRDLDFHGKALTIRSLSGSASACIIDCEGSINEPHRAFDFDDNEGSDTVIQEITIQHGYGTYGGAAACGCASPIFQSCVFYDNLADYGGAVVVSAFCPVGRRTEMFRDCEFRSNGAVNSGGAVYCEYGDYAIGFSDCWFEDNLVNVNGGAVYCTQASVSFTNCNFYNNGASTGCGGALTISNCSAAQVTLCTFFENSARWGGAICSSNLDVTVTNCTFARGGASSSGGGLYFANGTLQLMNCIIAYTTSGGPVYCSGGSASLSCCDVYGNSGGNYVGCLAGWHGVNDNIEASPRFCDIFNGNLMLSIFSPCNAHTEPNPACDQIGSRGAGCVKDD